MVASENMRAIPKFVKVVRPIMSTDFKDARRRALGLYRGFYRCVPYILQYYDIPKTVEECRWKVREYFYRNGCVTDIRVIDTLVLKGYMELKELTNNWQQKGHLMAHWHPTYEPKPSDFVGKFLSGID